MEQEYTPLNDGLGLYWVFRFKKGVYRLSVDTPLQDFQQTLDTLYGRGNWEIIDADDPIVVKTPEPSHWHTKKCFLKAVVFQSHEIRFEKQEATSLI